ncbi:SusC/RagA family TonB-linked outer membrane protein [Flavobacterium granuli]|uniref:TonB-linked SusC/RagA family outer membrane protein n=1 Tax=Flavobacterium granuli TaxID=280093 RepID=A0A1M5RDL2_9FLAO|nr:TonB-dependent receptor [Flavobacterium granuli]PRZ21702.1 TonB-linked SusC/RagA family outer membrane protein [Flavobacterium granuli]SHH24220.1 TonB-linked outer membrane protein, SusC/RagA family [Flavobacterium granuli]
MKNSLLKGLTLFLMILCTSLTYSQEVSGVVSDSNGPLPGATVLVKGTTNGAQTDMDGKFRVKNVGSNAVLIFSYIGLKTQELNVAGKSIVNVILKEDSAELKEVLVIGFGKQSKRKVTDNIASISADQIGEIPVPSLQSALTAKAAGVQITQINGKVEGGVKVRIRGVSSISSSQEPLYVIDGLPLINDNESVSAAPINPLISLNPNDIESIQILKDASSAAIYGARGTNGVVLITTKQGKSGKTKISLNTSTGWSQATHKMSWLNAAQYAELYTEASAYRYGADDLWLTEPGGVFDGYANGKDWRTGQVDTDWQDLALIKGSVQDHNFSVSGGDSKTVFFLSGGYNNTEGIVRGNNMDRYSYRGNLDHKVSDKLRVGLNTSLSKTRITRIGSDNSFATPLQAVAQTPLAPAYLDDGVTPNNETTLYYNFLMQQFNGNWDANIFRTLMNSYVELKILPELSFRSELGYDNNNQTEEYFAGSLTESASTNGYADANAIQSDKYSINNYFTFSKNFKEDYNLEFVGGMSFEESARKRQFVAGIGFPSDELQTVESASEITEGSSSRTKYNFLSYFGRATFSIMDKYLLKGSLRYDGSSRFGASNRYGVFPAASVGWIISQEDFLKDNEVVSLLKLRGSFGVTGNAGIGNFASLGLFGGSSYNKQSAINPSQLVNQDLKWEKTNQFDAGIDFGFLDNRITGEIDYYIKKTNDLLLNEPLPGTSGWSSLTRNVGSLTNKGFEFVLNTTNIKTANLSWKTSLNLSTLDNKVTSLPGGDIVAGQNIVRVGETISSFYLVEYAGVNPANGDALFYKNTLQADGSLDKTTTKNYSEAQRIITGSPYPTLMTGMTNTLMFKNFDFSFTFQGEWGASIYNEAGKFQSSNARYKDNQTTDQMDRWQKPGDITNVPQARWGRSNGEQASTRYLDKTDFVRLRNLSLGYTLPKTVTQKLSVDRARLYLTGVNLLTFTNYKGYDPESSYDNNGDSNIRKGIAFYSAPPAKTIIIGLNIDL